MNTINDTDCGCTDFRASRRNILKGLGLAAGATAVTTMTDGVFRQVAFGAPSHDNTLVVLSLRGGADGMSMVVPYGDPGYAAARPRIAVPTSQLLAKDGFFGLHPAFEPVMGMWNRGEMAAVQAVGLPAPNRSHFAAMEQLEDADPGSSERVGWLNRLIGLDVNAAPTDGVNMGTAMIPTSLYGPAPVLGLRGTNRMRLPGSPSGAQASWKRQSLDRLWSNDPSPLGNASRAALESTTRLQTMASTQQAGVAPGASYPATPLGDVMKDTARLLKGGLGVKVVTLDFGSWDMHVGLGDLSHGMMKPMIDEMARAIAAFFTDLGAVRDKVTLLTISEFGRRVGENDNAGLDHGFGNVMLAFGGGVRGGRVYGTWPGLDQSDLVNGDLAVTRDYRSVLAEILRARTGPDMTKIFPGFSPESPLGLMG